MKILAMGTGGFIIPSLEALAQSSHHIVALITMPLHVLRTGKKGGIPPVREIAKRLELTLLEPEDINSAEAVELLHTLDYDIIFICDYGKILSPEVIASARYGGVNLHGSLLPKYRGAAPINRAILAGEEELGISVIHIVPQADAGPVIGTDSMVVTKQDTAVEIELELAKRGAPLLLKALDHIENGTACPVEQDETEASNAPKLKKEEGALDWSDTSESIINRYRAMQPWPKTFSEWNPAGRQPLRMILGPFEEVALAPDFETAQPGTILVAEKERLVIRTGNGALRIIAIQPAGKKYMSAEAFLRGYRIQSGERLQ